MQPTSCHHRLPRAGIDTIAEPATALATIAMAVHRPLRSETILVLLDPDRRGRTIVVVTDTDDPDAVVGAVECVTHGSDAAGLIVASVRPADADLPAERELDVDRWLEMSDLAEQAGVEVVEWFVIGRTVRCPRDDLGEAPRW